MDEAIRQPMRGKYGFPIVIALDTSVLLRILNDDQKQAHRFVLMFIGQDGQ